MRLIPKKTKLNTTVWKSFTLVDIIIIFALFIGAALIGLSNIPGKWYIELVYVPLCVIMFLPADDTRAYAEIGHIVRYLFSRKKFADNARRKAKTVYALVPDLKIDDDGTLDYSGSYYGAVLALSSVEFSLKSEFQQNAAISAFAAALNVLGIDESAQLVKIDRPISFEDIAGTVYAKEQAAERGSDLVKTAVLKSRLDQLDRLNNVERQFRPYYYAVLYSTTRENLDELAEQVSAGLTAAGLAPVRLDSARDVAVFLKYCYGRDFDEHEIDELAPDEYIPWIKPHNVEFKLDHAQVDGKTEFTFAVSDFPLYVGNSWGAQIFNIDNTKTVLSFRRSDKDAAVKRIDRSIVEIGTRDGGNKASQMIEQDTHLATLGELLRNLKNENESLFDCSLTVTGFYGANAESTKKEFAAFRKSVRQSVVSDGFRVNTLRCRQLDGFIAGSITRRMPLKNFTRGINSESLAAAFPFVFTSIIEPSGMTLGTSGGYPFIFDPFKWSDKFYFNQGFYNANMFIAGTPGSGKSYFAKTLLTNLYSENTCIYILDPENEYKYICRNTGGRFIDVGSAISGRINPFHVYSTLTDDGEPAPSDITFKAHLQYLENFFEVTLPGITQDTLEEINNLIVKCYAAKRIDETTEFARLAPSAYPVFDDMLALVDDELAREKGGMRFENLQRAKSYLTKFAAGGRFSTLWNGASTLETTDRFTVFNFQSLFEAKNKVTSNGQMLTVLRFLEQQIINIREKNEGKTDGDCIHPVIVLDEGYMFIDAKNPIALDFIYQWYKRIRKYAGSMVFLTQNLADIIGNEEIVAKTSAIVNNAQYSFIFTLQGKDIEALADVYASRSLTDVELDEIQRSDKPKGTAFFMGSAHQRAMLSVVASETVETLFSRYITQEAEMPAFTPAAAEDPHEPDELETLAAAPGPGASEQKPIILAVNGVINGVIQQHDKSELTKKKAQKKKCSSLTLSTNYANLNKELSL